MEQIQSDQSIRSVIQVASREQNDMTPEVASLQALLVGRYNVIKKLGKGGQGAVYLAVKADTNEQVAIKQLLIQSIKDWKQYDLFQREADVLRRVNIDGVANFHESMEFLDTPIPMALIVQDYINGLPLQKFIANGHRFTIGQIGSILLQLTDILDKLHHSVPPIIHRDLKPSNIILSYSKEKDEPEVHLIDFGAVANPQVKGGGSTVVGTYGYMAPEQLMGKASAASDIYSLAIVAVYLLSGVAPENLAIQDYHVLIDPHLQHLPHQVTAFLRKMLEPRAEDRMTNYDLLRRFFDALRTQCFENIPDVGALPVAGKYSLDQVYSFHQPGNIVLWQELSDQTPRKIPNAIVLLKTKTAASDRVWGKIKVSSLGVLGLLITLMFYFDYAARGVDVNLTWLIIIELICIIAPPAWHFLGLSQLTPDELMKKRFQNARKSMATIVRIDYATTAGDYSKMVKGNVGTFRPRWKISYSFNPPDDENTENLLSSCDTYSEPDVKVGDLIPILYVIERDAKGEHVYSSPYPIPVSDKFMFTSANG